MKVVWGKFGTGVDLIVCAISSYWWVSLWVNEKDAFHAYSLKTSIIVFLGIMFFLSIAAYGTVTFLLKPVSYTHLDVYKRQSGNRGERYRFG